MTIDRINGSLTLVDVRPAKIIQTVMLQRKDIIRIQVTDSCCDENTAQRKQLSGSDVCIIVVSE